MLCNHYCFASHAQWECRECACLNDASENRCWNCDYDQDGFAPELEDEAEAA